MQVLHQSFYGYSFLLKYSFYKKSSTVEFIYASDISFFQCLIEKVALHFVLLLKENPANTLGWFTFHSLICCVANLPHSLISSNALPFTVAAVFSITFKAVFSEKDLHFTLLPYSFLDTFAFHYERKIKFFLDEIGYFLFCYYIKH